METLICSNIRIPLTAYDQDTARNLVEAQLAKKLRVNPKNVEISKRSFDARHPKRIQVVFSALFEVSKAEAKQVCQEHAKDVRPYVEHALHIPSAGSGPQNQPAVVGAGCAGLFCALVLAKAGCKPLLVELGGSPKERTQAISHFYHTAELNLTTNIQFGCGGAGTFSDGKLYTGTKSEYHRWILEQFVAHGAPSDILIDAHPHIGSDLLPGITESIIREIEQLGGEVRTHTELVDLQVQAGAVSKITLYNHRTKTSEILHTSSLFLATGHSARQVYELLHERHIELCPKPFAVGYRVEHAQASVNKSVWCTEATNPILPPATYKVVAHPKNCKSVFSFCMCPGGEVVAATSTEGHVVTNGASKSDRAGANANAALLVNVEPQDLDADDLFSGIAFQSASEKRAFELGAGAYVAPAMRVSDFLRENSAQTEILRTSAPVEPTYPLGVNFTSLRSIYPAFVNQALAAAWPQLVRRYAFFQDAGAVLSAAETRSSSPLRMTRTQTLESISANQLYVLGEGAGYAGGIMSAATDGVRGAFSYLQTLPFCDYPRYN